MYLHEEDLSATRKNLTVEEKVTALHAAVKRREDPRLITGRGLFVDDIKLPGMRYAGFVRSTHAHARIIRIHDVQALGIPGVSVYTGPGLTQYIKPIPLLLQHPGMRVTAIPPLAQNKVRYVGEPVAVVVASDRYTLEDALNLIEVEYEPLPVIVNSEQGLTPDAPLLYEDWDSNEVCPAISYGDKEQTEEAFRTADRIVETHFSLHRHGAIPLETRGCVAFTDGEGNLTMYTSTQVPFQVRTGIAASLGLREYQVQIIAKDIGGGFGTKDQVTPEEVVVAYLTRSLHRPIKWIEDRWEMLQAGPHGGEQHHSIQMALREDGLILAIRDDILFDQGAHPTDRGPLPAMITASMLPGPYRIGAAFINLRAVCTNKPPSGACRGFGMAEATTVIENAVNQAAREMDIDPAVLRCRNLLQPEDLRTFTSAMGSRYDDARYQDALDRALDLIQYEECQRLQREARTLGRHLGIGLALALEFTGFSPSWALPFFEFPVPSHEEVRCVLEPDGTVTVFSGIQPIGQGIESALAQIAAEELGVDLEHIRVRLGDTDLVPHSGMGSTGVRGIVLGGNATLLATRALKEKIQT